MPAERPLNHVVCQLIRRHKDRYGICDDVLQIMKGASFQPSRGLRQLAEITDFNLFVSTTFDSLLEKAINEVRFGNARRRGVVTELDVPWVRVVLTVYEFEAFSPM